MAVCRSGDGEVIERSWAFLGLAVPVLKHGGIVGELPPLQRLARHLGGYSAVVAHTRCLHG